MPVQMNDMEATTRLAPPEMLQFDLEEL